MNYYFKPSFTKLFKKLNAIRQAQALEAIEALKTVLESKLSIGSLGLKRLSKDLWEIRTSLKDRILLTFEGDTITFVMIGNHDDVVNHLKNF